MSKFFNINGKQYFTCEICHEDKRSKYKYHAAGHLICTRCARRKSDNVAPKFSKIFGRKAGFRKVFKKEEVKVLTDKYSKQGLGEKERQARLNILRSKVTDERKKTTKQKLHDKRHPDFKKNFAELTRRKKRDD